MFEYVGSQDYYFTEHEGRIPDDKTRIIMNNDRTSERPRADLGNGGWTMWKSIGSGQEYTYC